MVTPPDEGYRYVARNFLKTKETIVKLFRPVAPLLASTIVLSSLLTTPVFGADAADEPTTLNASDIKWGPAPPALPKGAKAAVLFGDPDKAGPFVIRLSAPAGYKIPPHRHSRDENLTVISGTFYLGAGDKMDASTVHAVKAGGFHHLPAKAHHYAFGKGPTIVQVNGEGPFDITYINPDDDPRNAPKK
jgi:quercetin dioxygenase-like cupin family protein